MLHFNRSDQCPTGWPEGVPSATHDMFTLLNGRENSQSQDEMEASDGMPLVDDSLLDYLWGSYLSPEAEGL